MESERQGPEGIQSEERIEEQRLIKTDEQEMEELSKSEEYYGLDNSSREETPSKAARNEQTRQKLIQQLKSKKNGKLNSQKSENENHIDKKQYMTSQSLRPKHFNSESRNDCMLTHSAVSSQISPEKLPEKEGRFFDRRFKKVAGP